MPHVLIEGEAIPTTGPVLAQPITPFGPIFGTGDQKRSDLSLAKHLALEEFGGGFGVRRPEAQGQEDRYDDTEGVNTLRGTQFMLETLQETGQILAAGVTPTMGVAFGSKIYVAGDDGKVYETDESSTSVRKDCGATITDMIVFNQAGTDYLIVCYGSDYSYSSDGAAWSEPTSAEEADYMTIWDNKLVVLDDTNKSVKFTATPCQADPGFANKITVVQGDARSITVFRNQEGAPSVWYATSIGVFQVDWTDGLSYRVIDFTTNPFDNAGKNMCQWNGYLYIPIGTEVLMMSANGTVASVGPDRDDGITNTAHGDYVADLQPLANYLLALVRDSSTNASVAVFTGSGWHWFTTGFTGSDFMLHETATGSSPRLWVGNGAGNALVYQTMNDQSERKFPFPGQKFRTSGGKWVSSWQDFGFPEFPKLVLSATVRARGLSDDTSVKLEYAVDDQELEAQWRPVGTTVESYGRQEMALRGGYGVSVNNLRIRATLNRIASDNTKSPYVEAIVLKYIPTPDIRWAWTFQVPAAHAVVRGQSTTQAEEWFRSLVELSQTRNIRFSPTGSPADELLVQVTQGPFVVSSTDQTASGLRAVGSALQLTVADPT